MGLIQHNSIIVSGHLSCDAELKKVYNRAKILFGDLVTPIIKSILNNYRFFFVSPDGSKEYWGESELYDINRKLLCDYIDSFVYDDGSYMINYADVSHGEKGAFIKRTNEINHHEEESEGTE